MHDILTVAGHQVHLTHWLPVEIREDQIIGTVRARQPPDSQLPQKECRERETSIRGTRLRFLKPTFSESPANVELTTLPVDVAPGGTQDLTDVTKS